LQDIYLIRIPWCPGSPAKLRKYEMNEMEDRDLSRVLMESAKEYESLRELVIDRDTGEEIEMKVEY
jgi:hypothetical protein